MVTTHGRRTGGGQCFNMTHNIGAGKMTKIGKRLIVSVMYITQN